MLNRGLTASNARQALPSSRACEGSHAVVQGSVRSFDFARKLAPLGMTRVRVLACLPRKCRHPRPPLHPTMALLGANIGCADIPFGYARSPRSCARVRGRPARDLRRSMTVSCPPERQRRISRPLLMVRVRFFATLASSLLRMTLGLDERSRQRSQGSAVESAIT
jgi:hypothetical protein